MLEEINEKLDFLKERFVTLREAVNIEEKRSSLSELSSKMNSPDFWEDKDAAAEAGRKESLLRKEISVVEELDREIEDALVFCGLISEENDESLIPEIAASLDKIEKKLDGLELRTLLSGEFDFKNAIIELHAGAGGTESCDWAEMLLRMYARWAQEKGFDWKIISILPGDEAGVKSAVAFVSGEYAYGYLRGESGVHRLVRISPFDSQSRRHTSFCSVSVIPEIEDLKETELNESDLRIETFRAGGHGGQHVNTTDSAVRITHVPTGITAQCQNERSQHQNKENAMKVLSSRLYEHYLREREKDLSARQGEKREIGWGSQIRSYVFQPYTMIKDHRTGVETGNVQAVMSGEIDEFINAYLTWRKQGEKDGG
jgi:peptide chain release factor 2